MLANLQQGGFIFFWRGGGKGGGGGRHNFKSPETQGSAVLAMLHATRFFGGVKQCNLLHAMPQK